MEYRVEEKKITTIETVTRLSAYSGLFLDGIRKKNTDTPTPASTGNDKSKQKESD